ncbi:MAG: nucleotide exchange factor GrpE [Clostridiales bacterium]|nr:nucleotide exchange factor GrpE [Clostridiales bacterium]
MAEEIKNEEIEDTEPVKAEEDDQADAPEENEAEKLAGQLKEQNDKYLRLMAEYANYQTRTQKEKAARYADAVIDTVEALLPIGDNLERALKTEVTSEDAVKFKQGIEMVMKQFNDCLEKLAVTPIKAEGEQFDPNLHNAVMHIDDDSIDDNTIVEEFMKGYIYKNERVVRHSMVKVAN